jgi:hypothetical protein
MKKLPLIAGILLGLLFAVASIPVLLNLIRRRNCRRARPWRRSRRPSGQQAI